MVPIKGDFWGLRGVLRKYARGKTMDWKKMRKQMHAYRAKRVMGILAGAKGERA